MPRADTSAPQCWHKCGVQIEEPRWTIHKVLSSIRKPTEEIRRASDLALKKWPEGHNCVPPTGAEAMKERIWDSVSVEATASSLLEGTGDDLERAKLLAALDKDAGAWLHAGTGSEL